MLQNQNIPWKKVIPHEVTQQILSHFSLPLGKHNGFDFINSVYPRVLILKSIQTGITLKKIVCQFHYHFILLSST